MASPGPRRQGAGDALEQRERVVGDGFGDVIDAAGLAGQLDVARQGVGRQPDDGDFARVGSVYDDYE